MIEILAKPIYNPEYWFSPEPFVWSLIILGYFLSSIYCAHDSIAETDVPATYWGLLFVIATLMLMGVHAQEMIRLFVPPFPPGVFEWGAVLTALAGLLLFWLILVREIDVSPPHERLLDVLRNLFR